MKKEILIPAGDIECLHAAVHNGADAVYVGLKQFGARKYARNFTMEEIKEAVLLCHLYNVRIYITLNTLIKDDEVDQFMKTVEELHLLGVDALIMQDFGMICYVRDKFPDIEIHASTQFNNSNEETLKLLEEIGVKRVVLSRELSLDSINKLNTSLEKEVFIHGALCISYSGNCYMSSALGDRSGNQGACTGCCRLLFSLFSGDEELAKEHLLSTKELNTSLNIEELLKSDIASFKIEGRMKSVEYVSFITRFYRDLIDGKDIDIEERLEQLSIIFNREFTPGHLFNTKELMNTSTPNHMGLVIGKVIDVTNKKIKIKLEYPLHQEDSIRFKEENKGFVVNYLYDEKDRLINSAKETDIVYLDNKIGLKTKDILLKTKDKKLTDSLSLYPLKRIPIQMKLDAHIGKKLTLTITDHKNTVSVEGSVVERSLNAPIDKERIIKQLEKLGETPFISEDTVVNADEDIFIGIKELNVLRRQAVEELKEKRMLVHETIRKEEIGFPQLNIKQTKEVSCRVYTKEQLNAALSTKIDRVFVSDELYEDMDRLYLAKRNNIEQITIDQSLVSEYMPFYQRENLRGNYTLNVTNIYSLYYLHKYGLNTVMLSIELTEKEQSLLIERFIEEFKFVPNVEVQGYGKIEVMVIKGNVFNIKQEQFGYRIKNPKNQEFDVYFDGINTKVLDHQNRSVNDPYLLKFNIRLDFYDEDEKQVIECINKMIEKVDDLC